MKKLKQIKNYILAFTIPLILCLLIFYFKGVLQNIEHIYVTDLRIQHISFLNHLKNILTGDASIYYSFYAGLGSSMLSTIIFYCISPINILLFIMKDIRYAILFVYIIKICLSGLTMYILLKSKTEKDSFMTVVFSSCYALSCFVINYFFCVFWFDSLYLAPLVVLGIDNMFKKDKISLIYILSLALAIICNIQMGFGLCVFCVVYYLYKFGITYDFKKDIKKFKQLCIIFIISSLCAGAISSGALLGFAGDYTNIASAREIQITTPTGIANIGLILKNFFTVGNLKTDYYNNYEPFTYCGLIMSFFTVLYLFNKNIDKKKKLGAISVMLVFIISFCIQFINKFWHLSSPVLLNFRYSIYLSLFLITLAHEAYLKTDKLNSKDVLVLSLSLLTGFFMIIAYSNEVYVTWSFVFLIAIFTLIIMTKNKNKKFEILLIIAIIAEIGVNGYLSIYTSEQLPYAKDSSLDSLQELSSYNDFDDSYRIINNYTYTEYMNDQFLLSDAPSPRYFSSIISGDLTKFFDRNFAGAGNNNYKVSAYDSPLLISLMGTKYLYLTQELNNSIYKKINTYKITEYNYETKRNETKTIYLYENPYALSIGYMIENDIKYESNMPADEYQNGIIKAFTGTDQNVILNLNYTVDNNSEHCVNSTATTCKLYNISNYTSNPLVYVYSLFDSYGVLNEHKQYIDVNRPLLISTTDKDINLILETQGYYLSDDSLLATTYDKSALVNSLTKLQENMLENVVIDKNTLTGEINTSKGGTLFLSIPYDKKFKIYVDEKETDYYPLLDNAFIGLDIEEGQHTIKLEYVDSNLTWYLASSAAALTITLAIYFVINKCITKKQKEEEQKRIEEEQKKEERLNKKNLKKQKQKEQEKNKGKKRR